MKKAKESLDKSKTDPKKTLKGVVSKNLTYNLIMPKIIKEVFIAKEHFRNFTKSLNPNQKLKKAEPNKIKRQKLQAIQFTDENTSKLNLFETNHILYILIHHQNDNSIKTV